MYKSTCKTLNVIKVEMLLQTLKFRGATIELRVRLLEILPHLEPRPVIDSFAQKTSASKSWEKLSVLLSCNEASPPKLGGSRATLREPDHEMNA
jgi:hypothetical protein